MLEYSLLIISTVLFGGQFIALSAYQNSNGKSIRSILFFCSVFSFVGAFLFLALRGFQISFCWYTLLLAGSAAIIQMLLQFAGIKALSMGRVEVYTLFNVAGGMGVAYIFGITYFNEEIKVFHIIGLVLVMLALLVPIIFDRKKEGKLRYIFFILCLIVFFSNGFFGTINKIHINSGEGLSIKEYLFYVYSCIFVISTIALGFSFLMKDKKTKALFNPKGLLFAFIYGLVNSVGMFLQYSFADKIPASILFPLSNAGALAFGLIIGCIAYRKKPTLPDVIQFIVAAGGMVLFLI